MFILYYCATAYQSNIVEWCGDFRVAVSIIVSTRAQLISHRGFVRIESSNQPTDGDTGSFGSTRVLIADQAKPSQLSWERLFAHSPKFNGASCIHLKHAKHENTINFQRGSEKFVKNNNSYSYDDDLPSPNKWTLISLFIAAFIVLPPACSEAIPTISQPVWYSGARCTPSQELKHSSSIPGLGKNWVCIGPARIP